MKYYARKDLFCLKYVFFITSDVEVESNCEKTLCDTY